MDKGVKTVAGFLVMVFVMSFVFHVLYVKGYAFSLASAVTHSIEGEAHEEGGHHDEAHDAEEPHAPDHH